VAVELFEIEYNYHYSVMLSQIPRKWSDLCHTHLSICVQSGGCYLFCNI